MKYTLHIGLVALLAASAACSSNTNPMSPSATPGAGNVSAVPEGTPTLKANTPGSPSPSSGATTELGPQNTIPVTLSVSNAVATHANTVALGHRFQLFEGSSLLAEPLVPAGGGGRTSWTVTTQLKFDTTYTWRARAELTDGYAAWSSNWTFKTPAAPVSGANRTPDPAPGTRLPLPNRSGVVNAAFAARPDLVRRSCQDHGGTWEFRTTSWTSCARKTTAGPTTASAATLTIRARTSSTTTGVRAQRWQHAGLHHRHHAAALRHPVPAWIDQTGVTASRARSVAGPAAAAS